MSREEPADPALAPRDDHGRARPRQRTDRKLINLVRGVAPARDAEGHSLPSDRDAQRVTLRLLCQAAVHGGRERVLAEFFIYSWFDEFDSSQVNEQLPNRGVVDRPFVELEGVQAHQRYGFACRYDGCRATPQVRAETIDNLLANAYEKGVYGRLIYHRI